MTDRSSDLELIKRLVLYRNANVQETGYGGKAALHLVASRSWGLDMVKWLIVGGEAKIYEKDGYGDNPGMKAELEGYGEIAAWFKVREELNPRTKYLWMVP